MENELIKIITKDEQKLVSARELHEFLEVGTKFTDWIKGRINKYGFEENTDFTILNLASEKKEASWGGNNKTDYIITIDMAKELSMVENNYRGKLARRYFINCEKQLKEKVQPKQLEPGLENAKAMLDLLNVSAAVLNMNDSSKLKIAQEIYKDNNIPTTYLPIYTSSKGVLLSATELLKKHNVNLSTVKFNLLMLEKGLLQEKERPSSKQPDKIKKFKNLCNSEFGENVVNPSAPKETQPMYYENKFDDLLKYIGLK